MRRDPDVRSVSRTVSKLAESPSSRVVRVLFGAREFFPKEDSFTVVGFASVWDLNGSTFGRLLIASLTVVRSHSDLQLRLVDPWTRGNASANGHFRFKSETSHVTRKAALLLAF
jgi:hypothetical protein